MLFIFKQHPLLILHTALLLEYLIFIRTREMIIALAVMQNYIELAHVTDNILLTLFIAKIDAIIEYL